MQKNNFSQQPSISNSQSSSRWKDDYIDNYVTDHQYDSDQNQPINDKPSDNRQYDRNYDRDSLYSIIPIDNINTDMYSNSYEYHEPPMYKENGLQPQQQQQMNYNGDYGYPIDPNNNQIRPPQPLPPTPTASKGKRKIFYIVLCCCVIFLILIVAVGVVLGILFLVQRDVSFDLEPIVIDNSTIVLTPDGFIFPLQPKVIAVNDNYYDIKLATVHLQGSHPLYGVLAVGSVQNVVLFSRLTTDFDIPIEISYNRTNDQDTTYFSELLTNCSQSGNLYLDAYYNVHYSMWAKSGELSEIKQVYIPCPIGPDESGQLLALIGMGM